MNTTQEPKISIIVPCRNEVNYIGPFLDSLLPQLDRIYTMGVEVLIADGMSDDGTRERIEQITANDPRIRLIDNPGRIVSTGLNLAIREAKGDIIIRMDVHSIYAPDYVEKCLEVLSKTGADNVGGAARTKVNGYWQEAIGIAFHSRFAVGGGGFHDEEYEGPVDTVTYGCWRKKTLEDLGMFDEELVRNQDDELNLRIIRAGGTIWQSKDIKSWYYPRGSLRSLFYQYRQYGYWKVRVIQKNKIPASFRHLVPGLFVATLLILLVLSPLHHAFAWALLLVAGIYGCATMIASIVVCRRHSRIRYLPIMPLVFAAYHFGYGYGFLLGIISFGLNRKGDHTPFSSLTRG
jgi:succinoglycan biosynthesis protein ExoA